MSRLKLYLFTILAIFATAMYCDTDDTLSSSTSSGGDISSSSSSSGGNTGSSSGMGSSSGSSSGMGSSSGSSSGMGSSGSSSSSSGGGLPSYECPEMELIGEYAEAPAVSFYTKDGDFVGEKFRWMAEDLNANPPGENALIFESGNGGEWYNWRTDVDTSKPIGMEDLNAYQFGYYYEVNHDCIYYPDGETPVVENRVTNLDVNEPAAYEYDAEEYLEEMFKNDAKNWCDKKCFRSLELKQY